MILYHGSETILKQPLFGKGKKYNDYGSGFYCTESLELAKEWACTENMDGYANEYEFDMEGLSVLDLTSDKYSVLHWLALLLQHRLVRISTPMMHRSSEWLKSYFFIDTENYDVIIGYRADDSYFSFARAFLNNTITLEQLARAMKLGKLGEQFVLKSEIAFKRIKFRKAHWADHSEYYVKRKSRDDMARLKYLRVLEIEDETGKSIRELMREAVD